MITDQGKSYPSVRLLAHYAPRPQPPQIVLSHELSFLPQLFQSHQPSNVVDVGGNCGLASLYMSTLWPEVGK